MLTLFLIYHFYGFFYLIVYLINRYVAYDNYSTCSNAKRWAIMHNLSNVHMASKKTDNYSNAQCIFLSNLHILWHLPRYLIFVQMLITSICKKNAIKKCLPSCSPEQRSQTNTWINSMVSNDAIWCTLDLTHWDRVTHICVGKLTIIGSDNGLSPGRCRAII